MRGAPVLARTNITSCFGRRQLEHFYGAYFIPSMPSDVELVPISRTVGQNRIVDEFIFRCMHTTRMDWLLPGGDADGAAAGAGHRRDRHV